MPDKFDLVSGPQTGWCPGGGAELIFSDIDVYIDGKNILKSVYGKANPGEMLAIMGPSGSGKTTLLNCLSGRQGIKNGSILLNQRPLTKQSKRSISYVLQNDVFFPHLTCFDTIWYTALLRLPSSMKNSEKKKRVNDVIDALDIRKSLNTKIGSDISRGLSGGERKRTNIACELLTDPLLMFLDEPTSGLDSTTAYSLICTLKEYARDTGKTIVMTIHQPSSQIFHMFDKLLLLCDGQLAYYGEIEECKKFFSSIDLCCPSTFNFADFILNKLKESEEVKQRIIAQTRKSIAENTQFLKDLSQVQVTIVKEKLINETSPMLLCKYLPNGGDNIQIGTNFGTDKYENDDGGSSTDSYETEDNSKTHRKTRKKWSSGFLHQYTVLTSRSFKLSLPMVLSKEIIIQTMVSALFCGMIWFRTLPYEENLADRHGLIFFNIAYSCWPLLLSSIAIVGQERPVINKERLGGYYRLSAYLLSKISTQFIMGLLIPFLMFTVSFWLSGINYNFLVYCQMLVVILLIAFTSEALGLLFGSLFLNMSAALTTAITSLTCIMLAGGFFVKNLPSWISWMKYCSFTNYGFYALLDIDIRNKEIRCSPTGSRFHSCFNQTQKANSSHYISQDDLLKALTLSADGLNIWHSLIILSSIAFVLLTASYTILRIRRPQLS